MASFTTFNTSQISKALVFGAGRGIGLSFVKELLQNNPAIEIVAQYRDPHRASELLALAKQNSALRPVLLNPSHEEELSSFVSEFKEKGFSPSLVVSTIGFLHSDSVQPEKSSRDLSSEQLHEYFQVNSITNMLLLKHVKGLLSRKEPSWVGVLNGRVSSIEDNVMGGWYGYRMSKASLNMGLKCFAIELKNSRFPVQVFSLHPGTVATALSEPFRKNVKHDVFDPGVSAKRLLESMEKFSPTVERNIAHMAYDGELLTW